MSTQIQFRSEAENVEAALRQIAAAALTLEERRRLSETDSSSVHADARKIDSRLARWCHTAAFGDELRFARRLQWDGLDRVKARRVVADVNPLALQDLPGWAETLRCIIETCQEWRHDSPDPTEMSSEGPRQPFEELLKPIATCARNMLVLRLASSTVVESGSREIVSEAALDRMETALTDQLSFIATQTLASEFSKEQPAGIVLLHQFGVVSTQAPSRNRYEAFVRRLLNDGLLTLFKSYPVLARLLAVAVESWLDTTARFLRRLEEDYDALGAAFASPGLPGELGKLVNIEPGLSDQHNGGQTVLRLWFENGLKLLYKPKSLDLEEAWAQLIHWCNKNGSPLELQHPSVLAREGFGWVDNVASGVLCEQPQEFYRRAGALLFCVYLLGGTDCHAENLIASGDFPFLVDLETLMHPTGRPMGVDSGVFDSVLRTGLLPRWDCEAGTQRVTDLSGLGQELEHAQPKRLWRLINTDEMYLEWGVVRTTSAHVPVAKGLPCSPEEFLEEIVRGFECMYRFAMKKQCALYDLGGPLTAFHNQVGRFIFRPTKIYYEVLDHSLDSEFLRDGAERTIELDRMAFAFLSTPERPPAWPILGSELAAMEKLDIPHFTCNSTEDTLFGTDRLIQEYLQGTGYERMIARLNDLNESDLVLQSDLIRGTFLARMDGTHVQDDQACSCLSPGPSNCGDPSRAVQSEEMLYAAREIGDELVRRSVLAGKARRSWLGLTYVLNTEQFQVNLLTANLYDGICGVAVFLAALDNACGGSDFGELALHVIQPIRQTITAATEEGTRQMIRRIGIGGALGIGSIIYSLTLMARFLEDDQLLDEALRVACAVRDEDILSTVKFDVVDGVAGCLLALAALYRRSSSARVLRLAQICGEHLLRAQFAEGPFRGGFPTSDGGAPMAGFSHGAAGIACSLARLHEISGDARFHKAAMEAFCSERLVGDSMTRPDAQRRNDPAGERLVSWCHGAPGMALARLDALTAIYSDELKLEAEVAVGITEAYGVRSLDSLCCGNLGRLETLLSATATFGCARFAKVAENWAASVVENARKSGCYKLRANARPGKVFFNPPLFHGMAGVGYQLLRISRPTNTPCLLLWR